MSASLLFDLLVAGGLIVLVGLLLSTPNRFKAIVLFICTGVLMSLAWVRLDAPDIALVEAAIGAGLTGALLLDTLGHIESREESSTTDGGGAG